MQCDINFNRQLEVFVSGTFLPSIPQIAKDLDSTGPIVKSIISPSV
jgi:hypothetical protein